MTTLTPSRPVILQRLEDFWNSVSPRQNYKTPPKEPQEEARTRRDFIREMLDRSPEAFQSEMDVQNMAHLYRCKF